MPPAGKKTKSQERKKTARCKTCGKAIRIPAGWSAGPAARKHYWRHHREIMQPTAGGRT